MLFYFNDIQFRAFLKLLKTLAGCGPQRTETGKAPGSFSVVSHSSWCPVEFGPAPIYG